MSTAVETDELARAAAQLYREKREKSMSVEEKLESWLTQPGTFVTEPERRFIDLMREAASQGVGYGWMQQVIEWEWQAKMADQGTAHGAWGPEYFGKQIADLEAKLETFAKL